MLEPLVIRRLVSKTDAVRFDPIEMCIYCGDTQGLTREHVVPIGLGGGFILPGASCDACRLIIHTFETSCLSKMLLPYRNAFGLTRRSRKNPKPYWVRVDGVRTQIALSDMPGHLLLPELNDIPHILERKAPGSEASFRMKLMGDPKEFAALSKKLGGKIEADNGFDLYEYLRLIAKIAHGFMVGEIGLNGFAPELCEFILGRAPETASYLIGKAIWEPPPQEDGRVLTHQLGWRNVPWGDQHWVAVQVRLFASHDAPVYTVMAGQCLLTDDQLKHLASQEPRAGRKP